MKKKQKIVIFLFVLCTVVLSGRVSMGTISSVIVTPAVPTTVSTGQPYYLAALTGATPWYEFRVQVNDLNATDRSHYTYVDLSIPLGGGITITARWTNAGGFIFTSGNEGVSTISASTVSGTTMLDLRFRINFAWNIAAAANATPASRSIIASAACNDNPGTPVTQIVNITYGFCNQVRIYNMAQNNDAADGFLNPYYSAGTFNITGTLIYNIPGSTAADTVTPGTITLYEDTNNDGTVDIATAYTDVTGDSAVSITVLYTYFNSHALGQTYWRCTAVLTEPNATTNTYTCTNSLPIRSDRVLVSGIVISQGGGRDNGVYHWKSTNVSGTLITINARMHNGGGGMLGDTVFTVSNGAATADITMPNGASTVTVPMPGAVIPSPAANNHTTSVYTITTITDNMCGTQTGNSQIRDSGYSVTYYSNQTVYWENKEIPGTGAALPVFDQVSSATTLTVYWVHSIDTRTSSEDGDFFEYRIYFRELGETLYRQWSGTDDAMLRDSASAIVNNPYPPPASDPAHHFNASNHKYTTIPSLKVFTEYEFYMTAVDLFGNETPMPGTVYTIRTQPYSIDVTLSDGIDRYSDFSDLTPGVRKLREANISVKMEIVTSGDLPSAVRIWYTIGSANDGNPIVNTSTNTANPIADLYSADGRKTNPNTWMAYLNTNTSVIKMGNNVKFVIESVINNISTFSDTIMPTSATDPDFGPNNNEWTFSVSTTATFTPWPTRVLNNVLTDKNPVCYPAYYLSDDAYVTITAHDIKGRPVATLLDKALRKGGQNIKDQGWYGTNKARKKLGVGLYYLHFEAKRVRDGRLILNDTKKVVVAK